MPSESTALQNKRIHYLPLFPQILNDFKRVHFSQKSDWKNQKEKIAAEIKGLFPQTSGQPLLMGVIGEKRTYKPQRVGVVFSGGQAAGGHNVIAAIFDALKIAHPESRLYGFLDGPAGIISGNAEELTAEKLKGYRNQGGFDLIGSGRTKIETIEQLNASVAAMRKFELDGLVIIGGDDSNTNAAILAEHFQSQGCLTTVVGVPKTIDGDLKNPFVAISFGFDTACKVYAELIGNIARDALSAKKYYHFVKLMGRSASHIALECALATHPNLVLIGEEVAAGKKTLQQVTDEIADLICERAEKDKHYGVILIPEGLIEFIPEIGQLIAELNKIIAVQDVALHEAIVSQLSPSSQSSFLSLPEAIQKQLLLKRDPHGNVQVALIETEKLLMEMVSLELIRRHKKGKYQGKFSPLQHYLGYEGRAGFPSNFDCNYCNALGYAAVLLILEKASGYMGCVTHLNHPVAHWGIAGVPLTALMDMETRKGKVKPVIQKALVDLHGKAFHWFAKERGHWRIEDAYRFPGPMQFYGDPELSESVPISVAMELQELLPM